MPPRFEDPKNNEAVKKVRQLFLDHCKKLQDNNELKRNNHNNDINKQVNSDTVGEDNQIFYEQDIDDVNNFGFLLQRAVLSQKENVSNSLKFLIEMLKFRKNMMLRDITDYDMPSDFFEIGGCFEYEPDKNGNKVLYIRTKFVRCIPELSLAFKKFAAHLVYKIDERDNFSPWTLVLDFQSTGWQSYDFDLLLFFLTLLRDTFPSNIDKILLVNFPWIFSAGWLLAKRSIPEDKRDLIKFISTKDMLEYIDQHNLPDFLDGNCEKSYKLAPKCKYNILQYMQSLEPPVPPKRMREIAKKFTGVFEDSKIEAYIKEIDSLG